MPNFFQKFFNRTKQPSFSPNFWAGGLMPPDYTDYLDAYASVGWWHGGVFHLALGMSEVKWTLHDCSNKDKPQQILDHPILDFLHLVNPFQTSEEFIALDTIYMESLGESFWVLNYNNANEPAEAILAYPHLMSVIRDKAFPYVRGYLYGRPPNVVPLGVDEVIHFKYPNPSNQYRGLGQARAIGKNLSTEKNADKWQDVFFANSARPDAVIEFDYTLSDEQFEKLKKQWKEKYQGVNKAHQVALLEGGGQYKQIQNSIKDMDFPNLKQKNRDVILGVLGMPQSEMGISENVNKANAEAGEYQFAKNLIKPRLDWKRAKLQEQLLPKFKNSQNLRLGFEEVVPETIDQKRELAESGMRAGYLTVDEARKLQGLDPLPNDNGNILLIPLNMLPTPVQQTQRPPEPPKQIEQTESIPLLSSKDIELTIAESEGIETGRYSPEKKREIWDRLIQKTLRQEQAFIRVFNKFWHSQKDEIVDYFALHQDLPTLDTEKTAQIFQPIIELIFAESMVNTEGKQFEDLLDTIALEWISTRSLELARNIDSTTVTALRKTLRDGYAQGESIGELTRRIKDYYDVSETWRAERTARTEVFAASSEGQLHQYELEGLGKVEFYPAPDACSECLARVGEYPVVEAHGVIPVHPNCRCTWLVV